MGGDRGALEHREVITLSRDQLNARLVGGHQLVQRSDGTVTVVLRDELVPAELFDDVRARGLVEEVAPGRWMISEKGWRMLR